MNSTVNRLVKVVALVLVVVCLLEIPHSHTKYAGLAAVPWTISRPESVVEAASSPTCAFVSPAFSFAGYGDAPQHYARAFLQARASENPDADLAELSAPFLQHFSVPPAQSLPNNAGNMKIRSCTGEKVVQINAAPDPSIELTIPILIGVASTVEQIEKKMPSLLSELSRTKASLVGIVEERDDLKYKENIMRDRGLDITLYSSPLQYPLSYFSLVRVFSEHIAKRRAYTKWVIWSDEDTFFPSIRSIGQRLSGLDELENHYIGGMSERTSRSKKVGKYAHAGGGIIMSRSVLARLEEEYDRCLAADLLEWENDKYHGDAHLAGCLAHTRIDLNLTVWPELMPFDMHGDPSGIYESGREILSFNHWSENSWVPAPVVKMASVSDIAGESILRHRYIFDRNVVTKSSSNPQSGLRRYSVLTNGYSIVQYTIAPGKPDVDLSTIEATWGEVGESGGLNDYEQEIGPLRNATADGVEQKRWRLEKAKIVLGNLHQLYVWRGKRSQRKHPSGRTEESWIEIIWLGRSTARTSGT